jgi:hypothetical protein
VGILNHPFGADGKKHQKQQRHPQVPLFWLENRLTGFPPRCKNQLFFGARDAEAFVETLNTTTGVNDTLFAGEERVASTTHVQVQVMSSGGTGFDDVTARASSGNFNVIRVNTFFHGKPLFKAVSLSGPVPPDTTRS